MLYVILSLDLLAVIRQTHRMNERTLNLALLISDNLEELSDQLTREGVEHDKKLLLKTAKYLGGRTISFEEWRKTQV